MTHTKPLIPDVPFHPGPNYSPPPKPIRSNVPRSQESSQSSSSVENIDLDINLDFEEGVISEFFQRLDKSFFQDPIELNVLINTGNLIQKFLPKQADIDKILKVIQRKVLKAVADPGGPWGPWTLAPNFHFLHMKICTKQDLWPPALILHLGPLSQSWICY